MTGLNECSIRRTAQATAGESALIACSLRREVCGPNGEADVAFLVRSDDRGATWSVVPLCRPVSSQFWYWGFPVWPPEFIASVALDGGTARIVFRDEWVLFEPGGESLWAGAQRSDGLWRIERVRYMRYEESSDEAIPVSPVESSLPEGFEEPAPGALAALGAEVARITRPPPERLLIEYVAIGLAGLTAAFTGSLAFAVALALGLVAGKSVVSMLGERRQARAHARRLHGVLNPSSGNAIVGGTGSVRNLAQR